jgi:hypothetical protein
MSKHLTPPAVATIHTHEWRGAAAEAHACVPSVLYLVVQRLAEGPAVLVSLLVVEVLPDLFFRKALYLILYGLVRPQRSGRRRP